MLKLMINDGRNQNLYSSISEVLTLISLTYQTVLSFVPSEQERMWRSERRRAGEVLWSHTRSDFSRV